MLRPIQATYLFVIDGFNEYLLFTKVLTCTEILIRDLVMFNKLKIIIQYLVPHHALSRLIGMITNCRTRWIKNKIILWFIKRYHIDMSLAENKDPTSYDTFNKFFTRKLKSHLRPIASDPNTIISPVDGVWSQFGQIKDNSLIQAKGIHYNLSALLGNEKYLKNFQNGAFATLYLSPKDYHRIHMPFNGILKEMTYVPGRLFSVNPLILQSVSNVFTQNERLICVFETEVGLMAVIMVGAMLVASINTVWAGKITPNGLKKVTTWSYEDKANLIQLKRGDEMGHFELGSTVILLFEPNKMNWLAEMQIDSSISMGQVVGEISN